MKRLLSLILVLALSLSMFSVSTLAQQTETEVTPRNTIITSASVTLSISSSGLASIKSTCTAISGTSSISAVTYLERYVNGGWSRVDLPSANDQWNTITFERTYSYTVTHQLTARGRYRAVTVFTAKNGSASETLTYRSEATY